MSKQQCDSCQKVIGYFSLACPDCGLPFAIEDVNAYELLGLDPSFEVDVSELEKAYFAAQRQVHPDRFVAAEDTIQQRAAQWSTRLNEAYHTLKDPYLRAHVLYKVLKGDAVPESSHNPELLEEMMELQQALLEDGGKERVVNQLDGCLESLTASFQGDAAEVPALLERYSYLKRLRG